MDLALSGNWGKDVGLPPSGRPHRGIAHRYCEAFADPSDAGGQTQAFVRRSTLGSSRCRKGVWKCMYMETFAELFNVDGENECI